jgi:hypothetical protein
MTPVTRNCEYCNAEFVPARDHQRFCSTTHRVYANRYGANYGQTAEQPATDAAADESIAAALTAARSFTPVKIADHKTVAAIKISRPAADPNLWAAHVPPNSAIAAGKIHGDLIAHIGDLISLANKIGDEIDAPRHHLQTRSQRKQ